MTALEQLASVTQLCTGKMPPQFGTLNQAQRVQQIDAL